MFCVVQYSKSAVIACGIVVGLVPAFDFWLVVSFYHLCVPD